MSQSGAGSSTEVHNNTAGEESAAFSNPEEVTQRQSERYGPHADGGEALHAPAPQEGAPHGDASSQQSGWGSNTGAHPVPQQTPEMYNQPPGYSDQQVAPQMQYAPPPSQDPAATGGYGYVGPGGVSEGIDRSHVAAAVRTARQNVASAASRNARRNKLQLRRVDPWSVMRFSFAVSIVIFIAFVVATALLYTVLGAMGVFESLNETISSLATAEDGKTDEAAFVIDAKLVIGGSAMLGAVNMVLFTALATLGAFVYNVCADLAGGIEVTLAERE